MGFMNHDRGLDRMLNGAEPSRDDTVVRLTPQMRHEPPKPVECADRLHAAMTILRNGGDRRSAVLPPADGPTLVEGPVKMPPMQRWTQDGPRSVEMTQAVFSSVRTARLPTED